MTNFSIDKKNFNELTESVNENSSVYVNTALGEENLKKRCDITIPPVLILELV